MWDLNSLVFHFPEERKHSGNIFSLHFHQLLFVLLTWFDFRPISLFYSVVFILYVQICKYVTNNFCSPPHIKINEFVAWHCVILEREKWRDYFYSPLEMFNIFLWGHFENFMASFEITGDIKRYFKTMIINHYPSNIWGWLEITSWLFLRTSWNIPVK